MIVSSIVLTVVALLGTAIVYGTDAFCALVQRPALAQVDDRTLVMSMGQIHRYGDRRMPIPGVLGGIAAALAAIIAGVAGETVAATVIGAGFVCLATWLVLYVRVAAPVNRRLTSAAQVGDTPPNARALQRRWDSVIYGRALLQGLATLALGTALAIL